MSKLDAALALAQRGFKVFPIKAGAKFPPLVQDWPIGASCDPNECLARWGRFADANIGIHCAGLLVLDVDVAKGGADSLAYLEAAHDLPETLTTITPSGGKHLFYRLPAGHPGVPNSASKIGPGLDIRSNRGYVVAPGSETPAGRYRFEREAEIAPAPDWLIAKAGTIIPKTSTNEPVADAPDAVLERARQWLAQTDPVAGGFDLACGLRDQGLSCPQVKELLMSGLAPAGVWPEAEAELRAQNAFRYAQNEPGVKAALPDDFPVVDVPPAPAPRTTVRRLSQFANSQHRGPGYLVKGLLQRRTYAELYGQPGQGKTFVALDLAYHVAAGQPWMERKVHGGTVLYLAYEGIGGMVKRAQALRQKYGDKDVPLFVAGAGFNLREQAGRLVLASLISELPEKPVLIVVDTFARALMGGDENSAQDVGAFNSAIAALIESTGACVAIIHHSGKDKSKGARGSSALLGAIDTEIEIDEGAVTARKQRDIELAEPIGFRLVPMVVGLDEDGDEMSSCVIEANEVKAERGGRISGNAKRGFDVLCDLRPNNDPVTDVEWREACREFLGTKSVSQRFWDLKTVLQRKGYIEVDDNGMVTRKCE